MYLVQRTFLAMPILIGIGVEILHTAPLAIAYETRNERDLTLRVASTLSSNPVPDEQRGHRPPKASPSRTPQRSEKGRAKSRPSSPLLQECLSSYVHRNGPFRPEGQSDRTYKSRSDMTSMCLFAISHGNHYWRHLR